MADPVLHGNDQDVALLRFSDLLERLERADMLTQLAGGDLAFAIVVEVPRLAELFENELDGTAVLLHGVGDLGEVTLGDRIDGGNGEPSFCTVGKLKRRQDRLDPVARVTERQTELLGEDVHLSADRFRTTVLFRVHVVRASLFVLVLVGDRDVVVHGEEFLTQAGDDFIAVCVQSLSNVLGRILLCEVVGYRFADAVHCHTGDLLDLTVGRFVLLSKHRHDVSSPCKCANSV